MVGLRSYGVMQVNFRKFYQCYFQKLEGMMMVLGFKRKIVGVEFDFFCFCGGDLIFN